MSKQVPIREVKVGDFVRILKIDNGKAASDPSCGLLARWVTGTADAAYNKQYQMNGYVEKDDFVFEVTQAQVKDLKGVAGQHCQIKYRYRTVVVGKDPSEWLDRRGSLLDTYVVEVLEKQDLIKFGLDRDYLLELEFNYSLNARCWNPQLEKQMIQKAMALAESQVRRTLREWPYGKRLGFDLKKEKDFIGFFWEDNTHAVRQ